VLQSSGKTPLRLHALSAQQGFDINAHGEDTDNGEFTD
jgi:hypothetical protein